MALKVLGIAGSLRKGSYNRALLRAAVAIAPEGMTIEIAEIDGIPPFNEDVEKKGMPPAVAELRRKVASAGALLIATPEYNHSVPGVLKNAIDWLSRGDDQPLDRKPCAIMGASTGLIGTARAQAHLRDLVVAVNMPVLGQPEILVTKARERFDERPELTDESVRKRVRALLEALAGWAEALAARP
ncbi:MAG: NAD(P)H-dependent oxidoreductase [Candidatus Latescibacterota bacterium]|jgi:chromate reductase|nr:MAG: NAD(P)H-dependent oxidoreductase [Candidatus Latescibacterota bacterium]